MPSIVKIYTDAWAHILMLRLYIFLVHKLCWLPIRGYLVLTLSPVEVWVGSVLFISHFDCMWSRKLYA